MPPADGRIRVLCAFLDADRIGRCGWVEVDAEQPDRVLAVSRQPALDVGAPEAFDEHGVTPLSVVRLPDGLLRLYYAGWQRGGGGARYTLFTGAAHSDDDGVSFERVSETPVLDRADGELHVRSSGHVRPSGDGWRMWYAGGSEWVGTGDHAKPRYALRHAASADGLTWPGGSVCLAPEPGELGFSRPCIVERDGSMRMWYSLRTVARTYELGYAESRDGLEWRRLDDRAGLERGPEGAWDGEMVGLSSLVETADDTFLFYNGNGYGATGFGVAIAEDL
jgi:hypothetical protein